MKVQYWGLPQVDVLLTFAQLPCIVHAPLTAHGHISWVTALSQHSLWHQPPSAFLVGAVFLLPGGQP